MGPLLRLELLGSLRVTVDDRLVTGWVSTKVQALLCYLAITGRTQPRAQLAMLLWGEMAEVDAATNLRQALANLRRLLEPFLAIDRQTVALHPAMYSLDVAQFEAYLVPNGHEPGLDQLAAAVQLYGGDLLAGVAVRDAPAFEDWLQLEREQLRGQMLGALHKLAQRYTGEGLYDLALPMVRRVVQLDPWREEAHRQLMLLLARSGQPNAALAHYETCRSVLATELGVEPMPETTALYERIRTARSITRPVLPQEPTSIVGRAAELVELRRLIANPQCRLLTITGPGGSGKTRLALQSTVDYGPGMLDGVYWVPLAAVQFAAQLVPTLAHALGFAFYSARDPAMQLLDFLREKELLLVLDNFDPLVAAGVDYLVSIITDAPQVKLLVTSRERLHLQEEWLLELDGLSYPNGEQTVAPRSYGAGQLFVDRAQRVQPRLVIEESDWADVLRICQLVEGLPLALELAAAALRHLSPAEIAQALAHSYDILATALRNVPERQRSIRAAFEYSWQLLGKQEQAMYCQLGVFRGGFDRMATEQVAGATHHLLQALVDKSLVRRSAGAKGAPRYELHELLRQYAEEKLVLTGTEHYLAHARHCQYYADWLHSHKQQLGRRGERAGLDQIGAVIENVRAAWQWAIAHGVDSALNQALYSVYRFHEIRGWYAEGEALFNQAVAALTVTPPDEQRSLLIARLQARQGAFCIFLARYDQALDLLAASLAVLRVREALSDLPFVLNCQATVAVAQGNYATVRQLCQESVALCQALPDHLELGAALTLLGDAARLEGQYDEAQHYFREGLAVRTASGDQHGVSVSLNNLGVIAKAMGHLEEATEQYQASLAIRRELGDLRGIAVCLNNLGNLAGERKAFAEARPLHQESLAIKREIGDRQGIAVALANLGEDAEGLEEWHQAKQYYEQSLALSREIHHQWVVAVNLRSLGNISARLGDHIAAQRYRHEALHTAITIKAVPVAMAVLVDTAEDYSKQGAYERAVELLAFVLHNPATRSDTQSDAERLLAELAGELAPEVFAAAQACGQGQTLEAVVQVET